MNPYNCASALHESRPCPDAELKLYYNKMTVRGSVPNFYLVPIQHPTDVEKRRRQIKDRLERLENGRRNLKADQKWPTQKSMSLHLYQQLKDIPEIVIHPPSPCPREDTADSAWNYSHSRSTAVRPAPALLAHCKINELIEFFPSNLNSFS
jgi:hypothetical protein